MKHIKRTFKLSGFIFVIAVLQFVLSNYALAAITADEVVENLGEYSSWIESVSDYEVELKCPDANVDENYYSDMVNDIFDSLKGKIGTDYCYVTVFVEYTTEENGTDMDAFKTRMFDIERHLNVCWPEWSGRDALNFSVGAYIYPNGDIASFFVEVQLKINGQSSESEYCDYNTQLKQIVTEAENSCSKDTDLVKYYCDWISDNIEYNINESGTNSACEALLKRKAVCGGFANLLRDLCTESGILAIVPVSAELNHAWNEVHLNGTWHTVDLLNVVKSKSHKYINTYLFNDPDSENDYIEEVNAIKDKLYAFSAVCDDGLTWKISTNYNRLTFTGKGVMQDYDWGEIFPSWIDYIEFSELRISHGITSIGAYAFWDAFGAGTLTNVYLPSTLEYIGEGAFLDCVNLENIYFDGTEEQWNNISKTSDFDDVLSYVTMNFTEEKHVHSYGDWITEKEAKCLENGLKYKVCSGCSQRIEEVINATGHSYKSTVTLPTCTSKGYTTHECENCEDTYIDTYVDMTDHTFGEWETTKISTCIETGEQVRECNNCDYSETETLAVTEHPYSSEWTVDVAQSCTAEGIKSRHCPYCDAVTDITVIEPDGHEYSFVVTPPTCTSAGYTTYFCHCGDNYIDEEKAALGHSFGEWIKTATATCETGGAETRQCAVCFTKETITSDPLGHSYQTKWTVDKEATCTEDGMKSHHCERCSSKIDVTVIASEGHKYEKVVTPVTCLADGYTTYTCHCGDTYVSDYIYTSGHSVVTDSAVESTCTSTGLTEGKHCSACGEVFVAQTVIDKKPHSYSVETVSATCTQDGKKIYTCVCGDTYTEILSAPGHSYNDTWITDVEATCTSEGSKSRHCSKCESITDVTVIPIKEHEFDTVVYPPNCTEMGYTYNKCKNCTYDEKINILPANNHSFGDWYIVKPSTCTSVGTERSDCLNCDFYDERTLEKISHNYESIRYAPTCLDEGYIEHICSECEHTYRDSYEAPNGHRLGEFVIITDATCIKDGSKTRKCDNCEYFETTVVSATGVHVYGEYVSDKNASCLNDGTKTAKCNTCDKTDTTIDMGSAKGHTEVIVVGSPAGCTYTGITDGKRCSECGEILVEQEMIPQSGHSDTDEDGYCDNCNEIAGELKNECDCMCHKGGFIGFFYKIIRFFWRLFRINKTCDCGIVHY